MTSPRSASSVLGPAQMDRAIGAILAAAAGDALGAGYEFGSAPVDAEGPRMIGGGLGGFAPGEWTDDTAMTWAVLDAAGSGASLDTDEGLTRVARSFRAWYESDPPDIGSQTRRVLRAAGDGTDGEGPTAQDLLQASRQEHQRTGHTAGNGSLMRTAPVALAHLHDENRVVTAAVNISRLTHWDPLNAEACVLWSLAIRHAILTGELDVRVGLDAVERFSEGERGQARRVLWERTIRQAEEGDPESFADNNGYVVTAFQAAWSAIFHIPQSGPQALIASLECAIRIGHDTDTVASIAGALLGARWGANAVPTEWVEILHGYPGITGCKLAELARRVAAAA